MGYLAVVLFCVCWSCGAFLVIRLAGLGVRLLRVLRDSFCVLCCCLVCLGLQFGCAGRVLWFYGGLFACSAILVL